MSMAPDARSEFDPKEIARAAFPTAFRGYDQDAVRRYLTRLATAIGRAQAMGRLGAVDQDRGDHARAAELEMEITGLQTRLAELEDELRIQAEAHQVEIEQQAQHVAISPRDLDEAELIELLGQETAKVLEQARSAGADIVARAETEAEAITGRAESEARTTVEAAESTLAAARDEAEATRGAAAAELERSQARAKAESKRARDLARSEADTILAEVATRAERDLSEAQTLADEALAEAERLREDMLGDMVRRRRVYQQQLDRMGSARTRLGEALATARAELDGVAAEIDLVGADVTDLQLDQLDLEADGELERDRDDTEVEAEVAQMASQLASPLVRSGADPGNVVDELISTGSERVEEGMENLPEAYLLDESEAEPILRAGHPGMPPSQQIDLVDNGARRPADGADYLALGDDEYAEEEAGFAIDDFLDAMEREEAEATGGIDGRPALDHALDDDGVGAGANGLTGLSLPRDHTIDGTDARYDIDLVERAPLDFGGTPLIQATSTSPARPARGDLPRHTPYGGTLPAVFEARDLALTRATPDFRRRLKRAVNDDQSLVLDRLRAGRGPIMVDELPDYEEQLEGYLDALQPSLHEVIQAGSEVIDHIEVPREAVDTLCLQLGRHIVDCLRRPTEGAIESSTDHDREAILDPVRATYRDFRNSLLPDLIDDALHEAFASGLFSAIDHDERVLWVTDPRLDPDPICEENSAAPPLGRGARFPSGHVRPLSMPGCRCLAVPSP